MTIQNPHDRFFRDSFGRSDIARNYLEEYLPANLRRLLDLTEMHRQDGTFVDEAMQAHPIDGFLRGTVVWLIRVVVW
jgi:predicted transposase YdaD